MEYDTYRDPVGPLSASAQVLFGAIANFVTGLADVPTEMVMDLVTAGRALGSPNEHHDPYAKWHSHRKHRKSHSTDNENNERNSRSTNRSTNQSQGEAIEQANNEEMDSSSSDDEQVSTFSEGLSRTRTLQLEKSLTMSGDTDLPKRHNIITEAASQGSRMSKKLINLLIWLPTDLSLSLSKGFHNAPKLYHDPMVKETPKVIGVRSGFRAAGQVRNPIHLKIMIRKLTHCV